MDLSDLKIVEKRHVFEHPDYPGFSIDINYIPRTEWELLRKNAERKTYKSGSPVMELDGERFYPELVKKVFNGWEGLTLQIVKSFIPVEVKKGLDLNTKIDFSVANATKLMRFSTEFDDWVTSLLSNLQLFEDEQIEEAEKNLQATSKTKLED